MITKRLAWLFSLMVAMALAGCGGTGPAAPGTGPDAGSIHVEPELFPSAIGTIWVYRISYPGNDLADTVEVRITDTARTVAREEERSPPFPSSILYLLLPLTSSPTRFSAPSTTAGVP